MGTNSSVSSRPAHLKVEADLGLAEFDFLLHDNGRSATARYANNSNYRNDSLIRKESEIYWL